MSDGRRSPQQSARDCDGLSVVCKMRRAGRSVVVEDRNAGSPYAGYSDSGVRLPVSASRDRIPVAHTQLTPFCDSRCLL